jgi:hypothetical protein
VSHEVRLFGASFFGPEFPEILQSEFQNFAALRPLLDGVVSLGEANSVDLDRSGVRYPDVVERVSRVPRASQGLSRAAAMTKLFVGLSQALIGPDGQCHLLESGESLSGRWIVRYPDSGNERTRTPEQRWCSSLSRAGCSRRIAGPSTDMCGGPILE